MTQFVHPCVRRRRVSATRIAGSVGLLWLLMTMPAHAQETWTCDYIANAPSSPLQITSTFRVEGDTLREIKTIPAGLDFNERYAVLENNDNDIVAAISLAKFGTRPPPGTGAVVIIIGKRQGIFQQSGVILGVRVGLPTLGRCARKKDANDNGDSRQTSSGDQLSSPQAK